MGDLGGLGSGSLVILGMNVADLGAFNVHDIKVLVELSNLSQAMPETSKITCKKN